MTTAYLLSQELIAALMEPELVHVVVHRRHLPLREQFEMEIRRDADQLIKLGYPLTVLRSDSSIRFVQGGRLMLIAIQDGGIDRLYGLNSHARVDIRPFLEQSEPSIFTEKVTAFVKARFHRSNSCTTAARKVYNSSTRNNLEIDTMALEQRSSYDGQPLPKEWHWRPSYEKGKVIAHMQGRPGYVAPEWWNAMSQNDRIRVVQHLRTVGSLPGSGTTGRITDDHIFYGGARGGGKALSDYRRAYPEISGVWFDEAATMNRGQAGFEAATARMHPPPNGGKRIIRSEYTKLKGYWLAADGRALHIPGMDSNHIQNCLNLLKESHGNLIAKASHFLGKLHAHFGEGTITGGVEWTKHMMDLNRFVTTVEVDELYPVWKDLTAELLRRKDGEGPVRPEGDALRGETEDIPF